MEFRDKLIYLMNITNTSNKMLAGAINVDPSMISLIRTGRRGQPRNEEHLRAMASYFASKCTTAYQRDAIAEIAGSDPRRDLMQPRLSDSLFEWLSGKLYAEPENMQQILAEFNKPIPEPPSRHKPDVSCANAPRVFFGNDGKCEALRNMYAYLLNEKEPGTIYAFTDESSTWFQESPQLWRDIRNWKRTLIDRGFSIVHILPPASSPQFYETVMHWIPLYLTEQVDAYYYPRMRDNMFRKTLLLLEDRAALFCDAVATEYDTPISGLSFNQQFVNAYTRMFKDLTHLCQRTIVCHKQSTDILNCFIRYMQIPTSYIQCTQELPIHLFPHQYLRRHLEESSPEFQSFFEKQFIPSSHSHQLLVQNQETINMAPIYRLEDILAEKVTYMFPGHTTRYAYTPEIYRDHLDNVIRYMESNPAYTLIPIPVQESIENLMIKPDRCALIIRMTDPIAVFEIEQPDIIAPFYEYLSNKIERYSRQFYSRKKVISYIKDVSAEFTRYINKQKCTKSCTEGSNP